MSKKMLKRSLALGALMAFVITGSAMAAELTIKYEEGACIATGTGIDTPVTATDTTGLCTGLESVRWSKSATYGIFNLDSTSDNTLTISNVTNLNTKVYAGYTTQNSGDVSVSGNTLTINNVNEIKTVPVYTGYAKKKSGNAVANCNTLNIYGEVNANKILGAAYVWSNKDANAANNTVFVSGDVKLENKVLAVQAECTSSEKLNVIVKNNTVTLEGSAEVKSVYGVYAVGSGKNSSIVEGKENVVTISDKTTVKKDGEGVYGAYAWSKGSSASAVNEVTLEDNIVNVTGGTVNGNVYGAYAIGGSEDTPSTATVDAQANGNKVNLSGGTITGMVYGGYSITMTSNQGSPAEAVASTASNNEVNVSGTVNVENANLYGNNGGEGEGNTLNIKGGWEGSIGSAQNFNAINITEGSKATFKEALNDEKVAVNVKGATWNVDKTNTVGSASFDKDSVLVLKGDGTQFTKEGEYALNGKGTLTVEQGAKLTVEGIAQNTYNVATGFETISENKWQVTDLNTLMEGKWLEDANKNLQLQVTAKKAEDLAEDMGVSVNIANTMTDIITAANENKNIEPGSPEANVVDFANELANAAPKVAGQAVEAVAKMAEEVGQSAIAASLVKNVSEITNDRLAFNCGHSAPHKGGHGVGLFEEGSGADIWVEYVHGKDEVEDMPSTAGATSYEGQYNGIVMGVDFKKVNKFQSGLAFNYGEGDTNSVGSAARTHSDYDFWGVGYYGNIHNDDSNIIFDINYAKTDSDVTQKNLTGDIEASPETTTWTAGVKLEKLYQNENVRIVPYTGLRYMSIDADDYSTKCGTYNYKMERKDIWLLPVGVSIKQEVTNDNGWTVSPRVDLSYIWAFGDTDSNMGFGHALDNKVTNIGYDVMDDGSFLGLVGIEAHNGQWGYGIAYSYQKGDHSESKKWYVDVNYSF